MIAIAGQKSLAFEFKRQRNVQQIESAAAKAFGVFRGKASRRLDSRIHVVGDFNEGPPGNVFAKQLKSPIALAADARADTDLVNTEDVESQANQPFLKG